jgi:uncharacterized protein
MSDFDRNYSAVRGFAADRAVAIDAGLRAHMIRVYNYMAVSVAITGVVSWIMSQYLMSNPALMKTLYAGPAALLVFLVPLGIAVFMGFRIHTMQPATARAVLFFYAGAIGLMLAPIFLIYTSTSIARVFFITAVAFGSLSLYGYTTQRSLAGMGAFMYMGAVGIFIAILVNFFLQSSALQFAISVIGVLIFTGLTAYDTQKIKEIYLESDSSEIAGKKALMGALSLYLDFINLFLYLLRFIGDRR